MSVVAIDRPRQALLVQGAFIAVLVAASVTLFSTTGVHVETTGSNTLLTAGMTFAFFVARLLPIRLPRGEEVVVSLMVGLCALGILPVELAVLACVVAGGIDAIARMQVSSSDVTTRRVLDALRGAAVLGLLAPLQSVLQPLTTDAALTNWVVVQVALVGACLAVADLLTLAVLDWCGGGASVWPGALQLARPLGSIYLVHLAMAAVVLRVYPILGMWAFSIALLLTLILQNSFNLYLRIRRAYVETIGVLARAAELDRPQDTGHAQRVADLAVAVGRKMGLSGHALEHVGYAALLHDIGRIGYAADEQESAHAVRGAEIVGSIPFLRDVAPLIEVHHATGDAPLGATIVGVCCNYDRLRRDLGQEGALDLLLSSETGSRRDVAGVLRGIVHDVRARAGTAR